MWFCEFTSVDKGVSSFEMDPQVVPEGETEAIYEDIRRRNDKFVGSQVEVIIGQYAGDAAMKLITDACKEADLDPQTFFIAVHLYEE